ncbi:hypothetical protein [Bradyrhizobium manausense]|uniref:Uncharacterized protein n=1 Tax=Bradyrhizobium manausense TaxID=989370 RepID=A0A0R3DJV1_9BRAD|nr:hypothetical protein [Bradyrhizobium manausense]KRQ07490.1 hypothetical protein AOQ71_23230 [Bradyrhizobium manausense]
MGKAISEKFMKDLQEGGRLHELTEKVRRDDTLMLALRGHYINIYYRGGSILHLEEKNGGYAAIFDTDYARGKPVKLPSSGVQEPEDCSAWVAAMPELKEIMNSYFATKRKSEREFQQLVAWENNRSAISNATEYFITDVEFADPDQGAKLDMVGFKWPRNHRKDETRCTPVLIEMKYGIGAYDGDAGIAKHIADLEMILADPIKRESLNKTIEEQFEQLLKLGLVDFNKHSKYNRARVSGRPEVVFLLANHNPSSTKLLNILDGIKEPADFDLRFFNASFAGYGMHDVCMLGLTKFKELVRQLAKISPPPQPL